MFLLTTTEEMEVTLSLFCEVGISLQDKFCLEMEEKRKANIFENCMCQQVNMARNTALQVKNAHLDRSHC